MAQSLRTVLMQRDGLSAEEADARIKQARDALYEYIDAGDMDAAEDVCSEFFGLDLGYLEELM